MGESLFQVFFLIFSGAAVFATFALYTRQPLLVAYIALGILIGPHGTKLITEVHLISEIAHIGIIFLLFLLGLDMQPKALFAVLKQATNVGIISSIVFAIGGYGIGWVFGFSHVENIIIGIAMMFSSTIIGIKLLPTTVLHHKHAGELMVGLLLFQDFIAILCLMFLLSGDLGQVDVQKLGQTLVALPLLGVSSWAFVKYILLYLIARFDRIHEFIFLLAIGWCLGVAEAAAFVGLSAEIGAFIAGVCLATSPISQYIAISLKPLRDFFLILFFFSLGAQLNITLLSDVIIASIVLAIAMLVIKPVTFGLLLKSHSEKASLSWDIGLRLGQISEFSLLIAFVATQGEMIGEKASTLIQAAAIITFIVSSYLVIFNLPNPVAVKDHLRRD
ncbi:cation:proton antiporter [Marinibactrum halimedae]|uniref:Sodium:hydrogen antiporter n=1 Tax=Marinibactrum halimedae TaxID=1444977 RepID=A0AA37T965_9GAMM|nr:cation:proton antiporter [Marinibactrum halimedae]MCD9460581.1 cation:proton antiporter [Marinibactrum halimedae]GLS27212.1 sodium:hydrogen antiporter [Marinibactrum halimedae]